MFAEQLLQWQFARTTHRRREEIIEVEPGNFCTDLLKAGFGHTVARLSPARPALTHDIVE